MHGWAGSGEYFNRLIDHLDLSRVRAITYDMRGHGDSDKPDMELSLDRLARDGLTVADAVGASTFVTVGFSMSGKFAQYLAVLEPTRVEGLILVAGAPAAEIPLPPELLADWYARQGDAAKFVELLEPYMTAPVDPEVLERFGQNCSQGSPRRPPANDEPGHLGIVRRSSRCAGDADPRHRRRE